MDTIRRRAGCSLVAVVGMIGLLLANSVRPASANWFGASGQHGTCNVSGNITDNKDVYFDYIGLSPDGIAAADWVRGNLLNPTSLDTFLPSDPGPNVDVVVRDRYYTDWCVATWGASWTVDGVYGVRAATACYTTTANGRCNKQVARFSRYFFDAHGAPGDRFLVCHEFGHAVGLAHRNAAGGCMYNLADVSDRAYTPHDLGHINSNWATEPRS